MSWLFVSLVVVVALALDVLFDARAALFVAAIFVVAGVVAVV